MNAHEEITQLLGKIPEENMLFVLNFVKNLVRGRAGATGLGIFVLPKWRDNYLLRRRNEPGSLFGKDLSGEWELIGGGVELDDFATSCTNVSDYQAPIIKAIDRELKEEACLALCVENPGALMKDLIPAWLLKNRIIDLAFVFPAKFVPQGYFSVEDPFYVNPVGTNFQKFIENGDLKFFSLEEIKKLNIVSPRMRFMIESAIEASA